MTSLATATVASSILALLGSDVVGIWVSRSELEVALALPGAKTDEVSYAKALRTLAAAIRQPAYRLDEAGVPKRRDEVVTGLDALANLRDNFGGETGLRRVYLDQDVLASLVADDACGDAIDVVAPVDAARETLKGRRFAARVPAAARTAAKTAAETAAKAEPVAVASKDPAPKDPVDDRLALLVTVADLEAARRHLAEGGTAASAYAMGIAVLTGAIDQDAYEASETGVRPLGHRLTGVAGLKDLLDNFYGPGSVAGCTRRLKFDRATVEALRADDENTDRVIAFVEAMSARRQSALSAGARLRRAAKAA